MTRATVQRALLIAVLIAGCGSTSRTTPDSSDGGNTTVGGDGMAGNASSAGNAGSAGSHATPGGGPVEIPAIGGHCNNCAGSPSAPDAGDGGAAQGGEPAISTNCSSQTRSSRAAHSAGFSGSYQQFTTIYSASCSVAKDCVATCVAAGGTDASCSTIECIDSSTKYCLPPTFWFDFDLLLVEASSVESSAWITLVNNPYRDPLVVSDFQFEIPADAKVQGLTFSFNRAADTPNLVADYDVRAMPGGVPTGLDRATSETWPTEFGYHDYGGPNDRWGATWTPESVNSPDFGVVLTPLYLDTGGNAHAYVDFVRATVAYCR